MYYSLVDNVSEKERSVQKVEENLHKRAKFSIREKRKRSKTMQCHIEIIAGDGDRSERNQNKVDDFAEKKCRLKSAAHVG